MRVYCVAVDPSHPPLALGMVTASASIKPARGVFHTDARSLARAIDELGPGVVLFSDYIWNIRDNLALSAAIKQRHPDCITVHGGPDIPKDPAAGATFMRAHRHVDVAIDGEGEQTFTELLPALEARNNLEPIAGITFRTAPGAPELIRTRPRERLRDLDRLPSPYLEGLFDRAHERWRAAILETNRGCPYGCTFCDWGSATLQKIRCFGMDRIRAEIEWIARRKLSIIFVADANFGILPRDVEIAEELARAKQRFGYPQQIVVNYAKNATERVAEIIRIFVRADLTAHGIISLQTTDPATLEAVDRKNIKTARYEQLIEIFRKERLPLSTDLLLGLPEQTVDSVKRDLQFAFDWALTVQFNDVQMLVNSPMAKPEYVQLHRLATDARGYVTSTRTMSTEQANRARRLCVAFQVFVETGMLRWLLYHLQEERGLPALRVIEALHDELGRLPHTKRVFESMYSFGPLGLGQLRYRSRTLRTNWRAMYRELEHWLMERFALASDSALRAMLELEIALMPRIGRRHPRKIALEHDVAAYFRDLGIGQRRFLDRDRPRLALRCYPPATLEISDPEGTCWSVPEARMTYDSHHVPFELSSELRLEHVRVRFLRKRDVLALKLSRSRLGLAWKRVAALRDREREAAR